MLKRIAAEFVGTAMLLAAVVGSGIMAERLSGGNVAVALLANSIATGGALVFLINIFGPISGAHFNPVVTMASLLGRRIERLEAIQFIIIQFAGAVAGTVIANLMFELPAIQAATTVRTGFGFFLGESVATFGLIGIVTIATLRQFSIRTTAVCVACYILSAYWFTSSTSFANPAVTFARSLTDSFTGISPVDVGPFIAVQIAAGLCSHYLFSWIGRESND